MPAFPCRVLHEMLLPVDLEHLTEPAEVLTKRLLGQSWAVDGQVCDVDLIRPAISIRTPMTQNAQE